jgi:alanyl-tRNA synthetase
VLFTTAGMQQFVPYLSGEVEPPYQRACSVQKCFRTGDIDQVGDETHHTFFEMLGNWSFGSQTINSQQLTVNNQEREGGYWKKEAIEWALELLIDVYMLSKDKLWVTVFKGERGREARQGIPRDKEAIDLWIKAGILKERIKEFGMKDNFWGPTGEIGPCGPCSEIHYDRGQKFSVGKCTIKGCGPNCGCGRFVEIWNLVFMQYNKEIPNSKFKIQNSKTCPEFVEGFKKETLRQAQGLNIKEFEYIPLPQKNIDTGIGFERLVAILQDKPSAYETDLFEPIIKCLSGSTRISTRINADNNIRARRIIADHIRAACFLIADGVLPSKEDRGYVLRRILRRAIVSLRGSPDSDRDDRSNPVANGRGRGLRSLSRAQRGISSGLLAMTARKVIETYQDIYLELKKARNDILTVIQNEEEKFGKTLNKGLKEFERKIGQMLNVPPKVRLARGGKCQMAGEDVFHLLDTYGFPLELTKEMAKERGVEVDEEEFKKAFEKHQEISRAGAEKKFGGHNIDKLQATSYKLQLTKLHTATHLLHQVLRDVLGDHVKQMGSDINPERLRFDFSHPQKLTEEEKKKVEKIINKKIKENLPVKMQEMPFEEALKSGALAFFREKYPKIVKVYSIGNYSKEICAGPHVSHTKEIGQFKITSEKSSSAGVRRIKGII